MVHPIIVGYLGDPICSMTMWEATGLLLGKIGTGRILHACSMCSLLKYNSSVWSLFNLKIAYFDITYKVKRI